MKLDRKSKPIIKWPGGKSAEFEHIENLVPKFNRYFEPFFGGGAVFFKLRPQKAIINDTSKELTTLYKFIKGDLDTRAFKTELERYATNWEKVPRYVSLFERMLVELYRKHRVGAVEIETVRSRVSGYVADRARSFNGLFTAEFCVDRKNLQARIVESLVSKIKRIRSIEQTRGELSEKDLKKNIETAFRAGFYTHFRDVLNRNGSLYDISDAKKTANYYFVREFCYGAMFRYNTAGHFNIPYGGMAYNTKDFRKKVDALFDPQFKTLFEHTAIKNDDFEKIFDSYTLTEKDFFFLDPPYDSDFSKYENGSFERQDHERLARRLWHTPARFLLLIKKTPFIHNLYKNKPGITIRAPFKKKYAYNMKGRNDRDAQHLVIYNYSP